jgi:hypothetical protein
MARKARNEMEVHYDTFEDWKEAVDDAVEAEVGLSCDDLPDINYRDRYDDGESPEDTAKYAIQYAMEN